MLEDAPRGSKLATGRALTLRRGPYQGRGQVSRYRGYHLDAYYLRFGSALYQHAVVKRGQQHLESDRDRLVAVPGCRRTLSGRQAERARTVENDYALHWEFLALLSNGNGDKGKRSPAR